jgi:hypothetical protein
MILSRDKLIRQPKSPETILTEQLLTPPLPRVRLDQQPTHLMGATSSLWNSYRLGDLDDFLTGVELYYRRLYVACELCHCGKHSLAIPCRWWIPTICYSDVSQFRSQLGDIVAWLPLHCHDPGADLVLHLWKQDQKDEQV